MNGEARRVAAVGLALATSLSAFGCSARSMLLEGNEETESATTTSTSTGGTGTCRSACDCIGGAVVFVTAPPGPNGTCFNACDGACGPGSGVENALSTLEDLGDLPHCSEICDRIDALGCGVTCAELIGACRDLDPATCPPDAESRFACLATTATATCAAGGVRFDGCEAGDLATCGP